MTYRVRCEVEVRGIVVIIVDADSPEAAIKDIEKHRHHIEFVRDQRAGRPPRLWRLDPGRNLRAGGVGMTEGYARITGRAA